ncbi:MAG: pyridoxal-phosphate dependent enzyme [Candidatus Bathyarchaeia archaeon]
MLKIDAQLKTTETSFVKITDLKQHEEVDQSHLEKLKAEINLDSILKFAIVADKNTNVILDGEHRFNALKELGCKRIPVIYVDYDSSNIEVRSWKNGANLTKKDVIEAGLSGKTLPPRTSMHMIRIGNTLLHISTIEKRVDTPLEVLRSEVELINFKDIKPAMRSELNEVLPLYTKFLDANTVDIPIIVDKETKVILDGHEVFQALNLLSAMRAPAFNVNILKVKIRSLQSNLKPITTEDIIKAGLNGPKLPPKSFKVLDEPVKVNVPLNELLAPMEKEKRNLRVYNSTLELLYEGWPTPLVKFNSLSTAERSVWAKLEGCNPFSNSVKDRIGFSMIMDALENGNLREVLYEATSTNTGIALTSIANILGLKAKLYIPATIQKVSDVYLKVLGAEVTRLPVGLTVEAIGQVDSEAKADGAAHLNQFENDANFKIHLKHTASELDKQLESLGVKPSCIIGGLGTSGHMSAISFYFKTKYKNNVKIVGVQPAPKEVIPGIRKVETGMKWYHWTHFDKVIDVKQIEAIEASIHIARKEGLLIGLSAGAVVHAFNKIADEEQGTYVLILPDTGYKYAEQFEGYFANSKG